MKETAKPQNTIEPPDKAPFFKKAGESEAPVMRTPAPFFTANGIQAKLTVGQPGDKFEQQANRVADKVVNGHQPLLSRQQEESSVAQLREEDGLHLQEEEEELQMQEEEEELQMQEEEEELQMQEEEEELQMQEEEELQMQEEEEELQLKSVNGMPVMSDDLSQQIKNSVGKGDPLPAATQSEMSDSIGHDFSDVKVHTGPEAVQMNKALGAQAFTHGKDLFFNAGKFNPESTNGKHLLAHELTHVVQQGAANVKKQMAIGEISTSAKDTISRQGLLTPADEIAAINFNNQHYDGRSKRIIQFAVGVAVDGIIGPITVEGIATYQQNNGLPVNGQANLATLNSLVNTSVTNDLHEHAIQLVVDFHNLNTSDVLSIRHDPTIFFPVTTFEQGRLRVIRIGDFAFLSEGILRATIQTQLAIPQPVLPPISPLPDHLNTAQEFAAISYNRVKFRDSRSIRAIQGLVGANPNGVFSQDTVERVADFQNNNGLAVDGMVGEQTLRRMITELENNNGHNAAIRMIIDFYRMSEFGALLDIAYNPGLNNANATTGGVIPGPSIVRIGPLAFAQGFAGLVHTIAHELEHVRQRRVGIMNRDLREFLGERIEILSIGMPEEELAGFFDDASRALFHWNNLPVDEQRANWPRFVEVRNKVRQRFNAASAAEQATHQAIMNGYNAVVRP